LAGISPPPIFPRFSSSSLGPVWYSTVQMGVNEWMEMERGTWVDAIKLGFIYLFPFLLIG